MIKCKISKAFSLLEILTTIVIITILVTIGTQAYLSYTLRAKISAATRIFEEYQANAMALYSKNGDIDPYYVLFTTNDTTGLVSGTPGNTSVKDLNLKYVDTITAETGTSGSNTYIMFGIGLVHDNYIVTDADHVYYAGIIQPNGAITWSCGTSASHDNNIDSKYLPKTCQSTLP
jgi:prepilin-type N-terminal cleavage/methylation domain-containing protein